MKKTILWTAIIVILWLGVILIIKTVDPSDPATSQIPAISGSDHTRGNPDAQIQLIEYSDFQCPACTRAYDLIEDILDEFENHIYFAYRHFPLRSIHANAQIAAQAAEAAGNQDDFWGMYSLLFENQSGWSNRTQTEAEEVFINYADQLELDITQFVEDLASTQTIVNNAYDDALSAGLNSTPSIFLNGEKIPSPRSLEEFRTLIRGALE